MASMREIKGRAIVRNVLVGKVRRIYQFALGYLCCAGTTDDWLWTVERMKEEEQRLVAMIRATW